MTDARVREILPGLFMGGTPDSGWIDQAVSWHAGITRDERPFDAVISAA